MRVLQINTVYRAGGSTGRIVYDLKEISIKEGIEAYVAFGYEYSPTNDANTFKIESIPELKINILKTRLFAHHGFYNRKQTLRLLRYIDQINPDIIHLHNIHNHYVNVEMLFDHIKEKNIPVVWTLHDCWSFTGWCAYFDYAGCERWKNGCGNCPNKKAYPYTWFFDRSAKNYRDKKESFLGVNNLIIVPPCQWLEGLVKQSFLRDYPTRVIYNGIDINIFKHVEGNFRERENIGGKKIILSVAMGLSKRKGVDHIYKLANMIDNENEIIVMVGLNKEQIATLPNGIIGVERTNNPQELAEIYSTADVFVNPTFEDNYPTTNLEAIACGTPVVTYRTGGSPESVFEGCGEVVNRGDLNALYQAIKCVLRRGKNTQRCRDVAEEYFDKTKCFQQYIDLYHEIGANK